MRKVSIIGIGAGNPDHMTVQAIEALNRVDVFLMPDKGAEKADLRQLRLDICARFMRDRSYRTVDVALPKRDAQASDYQAGVADWHARIAAIYADLLAGEVRDGERAGILVWGDPSLYDSTLRIIETVASQGLALDYEVIPGITSVQALAAAHRIALAGIGEPVVITTGRKLVQTMKQKPPNVVVMLDGDQAFGRVDGNDYDVFWGACLGTPDEAAIAGRLADVADDIRTARQRVRQTKGWVMDTYLLRRTRSD